MFAVFSHIIRSKVPPAQQFPTSAPRCVAARNPDPSFRDLNALVQQLSADLEKAQIAAETDAKRADASAAVAGEISDEVRRLGEALATTEAKLAISDR